MLMAWPKEAKLKAVPNKASDCASRSASYVGIVRGWHGRAFVAVRDDDVASGMMGVNVVKTKATAFLIGAFYAGVGGALWAYYVRFVAVDQFTLFHSIWFIAMIIVGGMGSLPGALVGAAIWLLLPSVIAGFAAEAGPLPGFFGTMLNEGSRPPCPTGVYRRSSSTRCIPSRPRS